MKRQEEYRGALWRTVIAVVLLGPRLDRTKRGSVSFKVFGIPFASRAATPGPLPLLVVLSLHPREPLRLEFHLGAIDYTLAWPMIITSFEQSFRTRE